MCSLYSIFSILLLLQLAQCNESTPTNITQSNKTISSENGEENPQSNEEENNNQLEEINFAVVEHVMNQANKPIWFALENPTNPFIGRVAELSELKWGQLDNKITIITGPRGIGKTELARKYAQDMKHDNTSNILWLDSRTHESLITSFKDLAVQIGKSLESKSITSVLRETFDFFTDRKSIFILDHAASDNIIIKNLKNFISNSKRTHIIITSRNSDWEEGYKILKLEGFTKDNSLEYLKVTLRKEIDMHVSDTNGQRLAELLNYLPLALNKAVTYIIQKNTMLVDRIYTIENYIEDLVKLQLPSETTTAAPPPPPSDTEIEESILDKIQQEGSRIGDQIGNGASQAWEKISDESSRIGSQISNEADRSSRRVSEEAARIEKQVKNSFSFG